MRESAEAPLPLKAPIRLWTSPPASRLVRSSPATKPLKHYAQAWLCFF